MAAPALRCVQILASIEDSASGPSYSVARLSAELERRGVALSLCAVRGWRQSTDATVGQRISGQYVLHDHDFARIPVLGKLCLSQGMMKSLHHRTADCEIFHTHGLWLMPNVYPAWASEKTNTALVISPRGMLGPGALRFSRLKKLAFWYAFQKSAISQAHCLHATSDQEYDEIRAFGLHNPVAVIRNGIDIPEPLGGPAPDNSHRVLLSLGRIHPKKGLDRLLAAWARVERDFPFWRLKIVGPDELGYTKKLKRLVHQLSLSRVTFEAPIYGDAKLMALQNADLFVLPTLNENFGLVIAEALAAGTPVISTTGAPWQELSTRGCGWWTDAGIESLSAALTEAMALPRQVLNEMGARGRTWMMREYSWEGVANDMLQVYLWLAAKTEMPSSVRRH